MPPPHPRVQDALAALGIRHLLLGIQDAAFPSAPEEDLGRGSPYSAGAAEFLAFVRSLGFDGVQLGPQGLTSSVNPSPYDGTLFSRNPLSVAFLPLTRPEWGELVRPGALEAAAAARPGPRDRVPYGYAYWAADRLLAEAWASFRDPAAPTREKLAARFGAFRRRHASWLDRDSLYEVLRDEHGGRHWRDWHAGDAPHPDQRLWDPRPCREEEARARRRELLARHRDRVDAYAFAQFLVHDQHRSFQARARATGLLIFGDLQIGFSERDAWFARSFTLPGYAMGAPPSRTNPDGQPWDYPVLDPDRYTGSGPAGGRREGPAVRFLRERAEKMFAEFDGLRIDHPHGLVCPWVYRTTEPDPTRAVQGGARLFASPDLPDHPELARFALVRPDQIDRSLPRHADGWVRGLDPDQVDRYGALFMAVMAAAHENGRGAHEISCEVLSTQPYPLGRVMERHGLGRFRVTQKADLTRPDDVYRSENARPEDWIMLGNHDTRPIWLVAEEWFRTGTARDQAEYLAGRLLGPGEDRETWVRRVAADPAELVQAKFADLFAGPARNVVVYFTDLLGYRETYNRPGVVSEENWSLRVRPDYREEYAARRRAGRALDLPRALARALRARERSSGESHRALVEDLEGAAASVGS